MYTKQKAAKEAKANQSRPDEVKELKITAMTGAHDIEIKAQQGRKLLEKGWRLKLTVFLKGRLIAKPEIADEALNKLIDLLKDYGTIDKAPTKEGRAYFCYMRPNKK